MQNMAKFLGYCRIPKMWYFHHQKVTFFQQNFGFHLLNSFVSPRFALKTD